MVGTITVKHAAISWSEVELQCKWDVELVFQSEETVYATFPVVHARLISIVNILEGLPVVADASASAGDEDAFAI